MRTILDAAYGAGGWPAVDGMVVYIGGDTPNPQASIPPWAAGARLIVPAWVRSTPGADAAADAAAALAWLRRNNVQPGTAIMLDLESLFDPRYMLAFRAALMGQYRVLPYGSQSTLFQCPPLDGYWPADWTGKAHLVTRLGVVATQWGSFGNYDLSEVLDAVPLWSPTGTVTVPTPTPAPTPAPIPTDTEDDMPVVTPDGNHIVARSPENHLLVFDRQSNGSWSVDDVTDQLLAEAPKSGPYLVA